MEKKECYRFIILYTLFENEGTSLVKLFKEQFGEEKVQTIQDLSTLAINGDAVPEMKQQLVKICSAAKLTRGERFFVKLLYAGALANYSGQCTRDSIIVETIWPL